MPLFSGQNASSSEEKTEEDTAVEKEKTMPDFSQRDIQGKDNSHSEKNGSQISTIGVNKQDNQEPIHEQIGSIVIRTADLFEVRF